MGLRGGHRRGEAGQPPRVGQDPGEATGGKEARASGVNREWPPPWRGGVEEVWRRARDGWGRRPAGQLAVVVEHVDGDLARERTLHGRPALGDGGREAAGVLAVL
jgi:hypothetical protein